MKEKPLDQRFFSDDDYDDNVLTMKANKTNIIACFQNRNVT